MTNLFETIIDELSNLTSIIYPIISFLNKVVKQKQSKNKLKAQIKELQKSLIEKDETINRLLAEKNNQHNWENRERIGFKW
jgi:hypothetical protein